MQAVSRSVNNATAGQQPCKCACAYVCVLCVCERGKEIEEIEKEKERKEGEGKEKKQRTWKKKFRVLMSEFKPNANGKENYCISKVNKEQLTRYMQALSNTQHTRHTHTSFHRLTPSFSSILPSLALFFFQRLANLSMCACVQLLGDHKGGTASLRGRTLTPPQWKQLVLQDFLCVRPLIHQVQFGDHADGPQSCCESRKREQHHTNKKKK